LSAPIPFPVYVEDDWRKAASVALKGAPLEKLVSKTSDGLAFGPIHAPAHGPRPIRAHSPWKALARLDHPEPSEAAAAALDDLSQGAEGLQIVFAGAAGAYGYGLARSDSAYLHKALEGVRFDAGARFELDLGPGGDAQADAVAGLILRTGVDPGAVDIAFGLDPIGLRLRSGRAVAAWAVQARDLAATADRLRAQGFLGPYVVADGRPVHAAGGSPAQELGFVLATGAAYARALEDHGFSPEAALAAVSFRLAADADQFVTLSKFRALRLLWASVAEASGVAPAPARLHAETAWRMMSARDPFINVMRAALGAFSAGLGGADSVALLPFSRVLGLPDAFARRLARNTQLIESAESHLGFVEDPAAGAGVYEALTTALCEKAWGVFQDLERTGNVAQALKMGKFQIAVSEAAKALARDVARLKAPITGVSAHPDLDEPRIEVRPAAVPSVEFLGEIFAPPLTPLRVSEPFEVLRDAAEALAERPRIFLAALGAPAAHARRVAFARELFEAGGVAAVADPGTADAAVSGERFRASGAHLVCLCGADEDYAASAEAFARAMKSADAQYVVLAGRPGESEDALRRAGVDDFVFAGQDAVAFLGSLLKRAGAPLGKGG
jgi:methylmalonyl-CoA mutase